MRQQLLRELLVRQLRIQNMMVLVEQLFADNRRVIAKEFYQMVEAVRVVLPVRTLPRVRPGKPPEGRIAGLKTLL